VEVPWWPGRLFLGVKSASVWPALTWRCHHRWGVLGGPTSTADEQEKPPRCLRAGLQILTTSISRRRCQGGSLPSVSSAGCYSSWASPACYTRSLTCPAALGGVSGRVQPLKAWPGRGEAHENLFDPTGRSWSGGRPHSVLDLVKQVLVRHAAAGPCHGQLHPA